MAPCARHAADQGRRQPGLQRQHQSGWQPRHIPSRQATSGWRDGDIAFLKSVDEFSQSEYDALIKSGYIREGATKHPVIILEHSDDSRYYLVTTVSAYSSGDHNGHLPPWKQVYHQKKQPKAFRAFHGSERPDRSKGFLQLAEGGHFPKPKTSWVYTRNIFVVPATTLKGFDKTTERLRMTQESLTDLLSDMGRNWNFYSRWTTPQVRQFMAPQRPEVTPTNTHPPGVTSTPENSKTKVVAPTTLISTTIPGTRTLNMSKSWNSPRARLDLAVRHRGKCNGSKENNRNETGQTISPRLTPGPTIRLVNTSI
ncbi:uncharacterized protein F4822DRAFT_430262 [Hypoxylon trugodes]|uniref:uncharacterized protein n=1 Tax=Hypoxylon trugodes TaxID=326681 RepID=UPI0021A13F66|nr:uncharacterized protein F4822DRAFT_430262 [Hypoxylon trugodes]KAI1387514.1 hypothetical protein F4822DRAFT_430262 [Hypoxylon trugodes]